MTAEQFDDLLKSLGDTPRKVALKLKKLGITGDRNDSTSCPIVNLMESNGLQEPCVGDGLCCFTGRAKNGDEFEVTLKLPVAVKYFAYLFDAGKFDFLVAR